MLPLNFFCEGKGKDIYRNGGGMWKESRGGKIGEGRGWGVKRSEGGKRRGKKR